MDASENFQRHPTTGGDGAEGATWGRVLVAVAFFAYFFVFIWRYVDTQLLYHGDMLVLGPEWRISFPWFQTLWSHFRESVAEPGGLAAYGGSWLAQYFYYPLAGALIYTLLGLALYAGTVVLGRAARARNRWGVAYLSPLAVLGLASAYSFPLAELIGVAVALMAVSVYALVAAAGSGGTVRVFVFVSFCVLLFWAVEASCLVLALGCALIEWRRGSRRPLAASYLLVGSFVVLSGMYLYLTNRSDEGFLFTWQRLREHTYRSAIPVAIYGVQIAAMVSWSWFVEFRLRRAQKQPRADVAARDQWFRDTVAVALLAGVALLASWGVLDTEARPLLRANYLARMGRWPEMLEELALHPPGAYPPCLLYDINRALYETGQLPDLMFSFPQDPQYLIQFGKDAVPHRGCHELLLALGCVNEAEHTAYEALEVRGPLPYILRELILINIVKDRPEAARVFLNLLGRDVIHRRWAEDCLRRLDDDPRLDCDEEVARLRQAMLREDRVSLAGPDLFDLLLQQDPRNRMAFEYRMAHWLLTCQLEKISEQVPALEQFGYTAIPKSYAEALLMNIQINGQQPDLGDWRIDSDTMERFGAFVELTRSQTRDGAALARIASGTYYEYFFAYHAMSP